MPRPVIIEVVLPGPEPSTVDRARLIHSVRRYAGSLVQALGLPVAPDVTVDVLPDADADPPYLAVRIGGRDCRIAAWGTAQPASIAACTALIERAVFENRTALLTPDVLDDIAADWIADDSVLASLAPRGFEEVVTHLIQRLCSVQKLAAAGDTPPATAEPRLLVEALTSDIGMPGIRVRYNRGYSPLVNDRDGRTVEEMAAMLQEGLFYELGVFLPRVEWSVGNELEDGEFVLHLNDAPLPTTRGLDVGRVLTNDSPDRLSLLGITGEPATNPANGAAAATVNAADAQRCEDAGLTVWDPVGYVILELSSWLRRHAAAFLTVDMVRYNLDALAGAFPALVRTARTRHDDHQIAWVLRDLLDEEISIRDLRGILEALAVCDDAVDVDLSAFIVLAPEGAAPLFRTVHPDRPGGYPHVDWTEHVRSTALARQVSHRHAPSGRTLQAYLLDPVIEERIRRSGESPLDPTEQAAILRAVCSEVQSLPAHAATPVVLTTLDLRRAFRELVATEFPRLHVLSYTELTPDTNIQPLARIA